MSNHSMVNTLVTCGVIAAIGGLSPLHAGEVLNLPAALPTNHARMSNAYQRLSSVELQIAESRLRAERELRRFGLTSDAAVADRRVGVEMARRRVAACDRHVAFLSTLEVHNLRTSVPEADDAASAVAEARAASIDPFIELVTERLRRSQAAEGVASVAEIKSLELALQRLQCERDVLRLRPVDGPPPASREAAELAAVIDRHWSECLRNVSGPRALISTAAADDAFVERMATFAEGVRGLARSDAFFAAEADWRSIEAAIAGGELRVARSRETLVTARADVSGSDDRLEWAAQTLDADVVELTAEWRSDRRSLLDARVKLAMKRTAAVETLRREGHASWLEQATAAAEAESLRRRLAVLDAEERLGDAHLVLARRIVSRDGRIAAHD